MTWSTYYKGRLGTGYVDYAYDRYRPFLMALEGLQGPCRVIREEGCGIGTMSILYTKLTGQPVMMFDRDEAMVRLALSNLLLNGSDGRVAQGDIRCDQAPVDLIFSHGVLEHFDEQDIRGILGRQVRQAKWVVHYVPTDQYDYKSFGDERLESVSWWNRFGPAESFTFSQGRDLVLIFKGVVKMANSRVDEIVLEKISEHEQSGIPYSIGDLYEDAEVQFAEELARDE